MKIFILTAFIAFSVSSVSAADICEQKYEKMDQLIIAIENDYRQFPEFENYEATEKNCALAPKAVEVTTDINVKFQNILVLLEDYKKTPCPAEDTTSFDQAAQFIRTLTEATQGLSKACQE